jgi:hypothetical protein
MPSEKTDIIEAIFDQRWIPASGELTNAVVTLEDVREAIEQRKRTHGSALSARNVANFFKDLTRRRRSANSNWPSSVFHRGFTARQLTGGGLCFEFIRRASTQAEPFPLDVPIASEETVRHKITSAVLPVASRDFGRADEPWLLQIVVRLRIIETHLSLFSPRRAFIRQVDHLQNSVKLARSEIDAVFIAIEETEEGVIRESLITCEVKQQNEDLNLGQLLRQPKAAFDSGIKQPLVIPIAIKAIAPSQIHVIEFAGILKSEAAETDLLTKVSDAVYILEPPVPGIGE